MCERERKKRGWMLVAGREGPVKSKEKGLVTLHGVIHCATEITTEPSKSSFNAR